MQHSIRTLILALSVCSCSSDYISTLIPEDQVRNSCKEEAELLVDPVVVYEQPIESGYEETVLESGRFIYRCKKHGGWMAVLYPRSGEKIDCSYRKKNQQCPLGWVKGDLKTQAFD